MAIDVGALKRFFLVYRTILCIVYCPNPRCKACLYGNKISVRVALAISIWKFTLNDHCMMIDNKPSGLFRMMSLVVLAGTEWVSHQYLSKDNSSEPGSPAAIFCKASLSTWKIENSALKDAIINSSKNF